ncbi:PAK4-inhibitor INKA2 [Spea bombifrons]|uniref:PAK4-inhibitor INKA2 n=1 Tax=Spea bombifrons TaxID=233779 RepID=UPI00234B5061|nr:PAK4-inhibitor INKA2 [Spea bombifrons]
MDQYILKLKQELLSMKEVGEDLQEQMNSMMGALQELKLLQVQTALEQLEISREPNQILQQNQRCQNGWEASEARHKPSQQTEKPMADGQRLDNRSLDSSRGSCARSSPRSVSMPGARQGHQVLSIQDEMETRFTSSSAVSSAALTLPTYEQQLKKVDLHSQHPTDFTSVPLDQEDCMDEPFLEETKDWTSSLMSQSRNRQPLVLGDNIFADLVGNWLDLPELEKKVDRSGNLRSNYKSQDIYKKLSLTTNFFKKFLRSVRPDRDKLLKEKPGWLQAEENTPQISKRPKKASKQKGIFYFPSPSEFKCTYNREKSVKKEEKVTAKHTKCANNGQMRRDPIDAGFDMNTVVWV